MILKNIINTYKILKQEKDKCCEELSKISDSLKSDIDNYLAEESKKSKVNYHKKLKEIVKKYEDLDEIVTKEDFDLIIKVKLSNNESSSEYKNPKPTQRKELLQKEIDKLGENPTTEELEKVLDFVKDLTNDRN